MVARSSRALSREWLWVGAGLVGTAAVVIADVFLQDAVLIGALILGPFVAAFGARTRDVVLLGILASALAVGLGDINDIQGQRDHVVRVLTVAAGCVIAVLLARLRQQRERELEHTLGAARDAQRLALALEAGAMGTWRWDSRTGQVVWDARQEAHYGLAPGTFDGTFERYSAYFHPDDREGTLAAIRDGMEHGTSWRFDHRVVWDDGSVHWLEGRGEPVRDDSGAIVGATGVSIDIDLRKRNETERNTLLDGERDACRDAERSTRQLRQFGELTLALAGAATIEEIAHTIVYHGLSALDADHCWFGSVDPASGTLVTRAHEGYPDAIVDPWRAIALDEDVPATEVLRTGTPIFVESATEREIYAPQLPLDAQGSFAVVPIGAFGTAPSVLSFGSLRGRTFDEDERQYVRAVAGACAQALRRAELLEAESRSRRRVRTLLDFSEQLAGFDDPDAVLHAAARFSATRFGRFAIVLVSGDEDGGLRRASVAHAEPSRQRDLEELLELGADARDAIDQVVDTGIGSTFAQLREVLLPADLQADIRGNDRDRIAELLDRLAPVSGIVVPLTISGRMHGALLIGDDHPVPFGPPDLELATDLGRRAGSALERARLWQVHQRQLAAEHRMVEILQQSIVPGQLPVVKGAELAAEYRPADVLVDVGGDWYDAFAVETCPLVLVVGDVAGHGIEASSLMGRVRNGLRAYAVDDADPAELLRRVHDLLCVLDPESMVTAVVACYQPDERVLTWARAGHPPPLLCEPDGSTRFLEDVNATPLGTLGKNFATASVVLAEGSLVLLYTDGLIERRGRLIDEGLAWLADRTRTLRNEPVGSLCKHLVDHSFAATPSVDDICVLALRVSTDTP